MLKLNSNTFYTRHQNELNRYIFNKSDTLHIIADDVEKNNLKNDCDYIFVEKEENLQKVIKQIDKVYSLIIITDLLESTEEINDIFHQLNLKLIENGKLLITSLNNTWYPVINLLEKLKLKKESRKKIYTGVKKLNNLLPKTSLILVDYNTRQLLPFKVFGIGNFINSLLEILCSKFNLGIKTYMLLQKISTSSRQLSKSIIIPAKNEEKNLVPLIGRIPEFKDMEIIIVCGASEDNTLGVANSIKEKSSFNIQVIEQSGKGKANAVFEALAITRNDAIAILDSDISVDPETLTDFFRILENGEADFVNGTRFVYRMEKDSMRFFNIIGNKIFQFLIAIVISRNLSDSLCGTKVFQKELKEKILTWQVYNKAPDPFGDFDMLFSAAFSGQSIAEYPIHYRSRQYGKTQISRFRDGFKLFYYFINSVVNFNSSIDRELKHF
ncbi:glycosyltransferase family 2 protein [Acidimicrobiia bacterium]|nr:glycosyltransferase family 2 protein [Acidimicrobiia bacterium]